MARTPLNVLNERNSLTSDGRGTIAYHLPRPVIALVTVDVRGRVRDGPWGGVVLCGWPSKPVWLAPSHHPRESALQCSARRA